MHLKNPILMWETAYLTTKGLLDFAVSHNCKSFLFISTYEVYGNINSEELIKEDSYNQIDTSQLRNIYPISKQMCESMCIAYSSKYGIKTSSARLTSTFGNGVKYDDARFFAEFARCIIENRDIVLKSTGGTVRSYLDSDDAATAFLYIAADNTKEQNYNVTNMSNKVSIKEIAEKMISVSGSNVKIVFDIAEDIKSLGFRKEGCTLMDAEKLYSLGWEPVYTIEDTIEKLLNSMKTDKK
jgi:dTDP-glucose 4,6-dehydratase